VAVDPSELRAHLYRLLDEVLDSGVPLEVERRGRRLRIVPDEARNRLDRLVPHPGFVEGDVEDLVEVDWSTAWVPDAG
jgi:hypothetical protein